MVFARSRKSYRALHLIVGKAGLAHRIAVASAVSNNCSRHQVVLRNLSAALSFFLVCNALSVSVCLGLLRRHRQPPYLS